MKFINRNSRKINLSPFSCPRFQKGKVTILFITHQLPKGLKVDDAVILGKQQEEVLQDTVKDEGA